MNKKIIIRRALDLAMTILSVLLMGGLFLFPSDVVHEILGVALIFLWASHIVLNRNFYKSLFKGKYTPFRIVMTVINTALLASCVLLAVSGVMLSNHIFVFLGIEHGMGFARLAHLAASHWYYILIALHFSLHAGAVFSGLKLKEKSRAVRVIVNCAVGALSLYGLFAFVRLGLWKYMFLAQEFFFFDMQRGFALFVLDYVSIFVLFAAVGYWVNNGLLKK
ncbi:DUF4405 domain-containing protein [Treponema sp.]|uniref:DUF4405 domain-containing protein n=1 Tax=Treponema sp. TaxID=166 RepID=UPI003F116FBF